MNSIGLKVILQEAQEIGGIFGMNIKENVVSAFILIIVGWVIVDAITHWAIAALHGNPLFTALAIVIALVYAGKHLAEVLNTVGTQGN